MYLKNVITCKHSLKVYIVKIKKLLLQMKMMTFLKNIHFSVFGLGSTAYPKFAAFGRHLEFCFDIFWKKKNTAF